MDAPSATAAPPTTARQAYSMPAGANNNKPQAVRAIFTNCSSTDTIAFLYTRRTPVKYPARAEERDMAGRLMAKTRRDGIVRTSPSKWMPMASDSKNRITAAPMPNSRLYAIQPRITRRRRAEPWAKFSSSLSLRAWAVRRTAAKLTPEAATVTDKPYILITSVRSPIPSAPTLALT